VSDKTGWEGRDQSRGTQVGAHEALSRALGLAKENNCALEPLDEYIVQGYSGAKTEIPVKTFFVIGDDGSSADVRIVEPNRTAHDVFYFPHLQTIPDESGRANLMALPSCPLFWDEP
jgi:hypothetical protein